MAIYSEETIAVNFAQGLYSADLPSAIPEGYCSVCENVVATGTSIESRYGFKNTSDSISYEYTEHTSTRVAPFMSFLGSTGNTNNPSIMWGDEGASGGATNNIHFVRDGNPFNSPAGAITTDGYFVATFPSKFLSAVNYNGNVYFSTDAGVYKITSITWGAVPSFSYAPTASMPVGLTGELIHFVDRLWSVKNNILYYTDPPISPGANPDIWSTTNFIVVVGKQGPANIYKMIPIGTRIYLFTSVGIFILSVLGSPTDWYVRSYDESAFFNSYECAFERQGIIYYVTNTGVYLTTGSNTVKLSGMIENYFLQGNYEADNPTGARKSNIYRIFYLDGGMVVSIGTYFQNSVNSEVYYDTPESKTLYSRMDNVAWSEWNMNADGTKDDIGSFMGIVDSVITYINKAPVTLMWMNHSRSTLAAPLRGRLELFTYDGLQDVWTNASAANETEDIRARISTRFFEGNNILDMKRIVYAYIEMFMPNPHFYANINPVGLASKTYWSYAWNTDQTTYTPSAEVMLGQEVPDSLGQEFALIKLATDFVFRTAQFDMTIYTKDNCNFKLKNLYLKQFGMRDGTQYTQ